jgi:L-ribulose-5-phosphate 3-epimerase
MLKAISYWSMPGGLDGSCTIPDALRLAGNAGFDAIELAVGENGALNIHSSERQCAEYRKMIDASGVRCETLAAGLTWGCSPTDNDPAVRQRSIEIHAAALQRAAWLGCKSMLYVPGAVRVPWDTGYGPVRYDNALRWAREAVAHLLPIAQALKVQLCVENVWNGMFYSPLELADFVDSFGRSDYMGVYFDVGNVLGYHQHPPHWIELLGDRIRRVHIKDFKRSVGTLDGFCDLLEGDVPWQESVAALRGIGYDLTITAEMIPHSPGLLERTSAAMDRILAM